MNKESHLVEEMNKIIGNDSLLVINGLTDSELREFATRLKWGTLGPDGNDVRKFKTLNDLATDHLESILITQRQISKLYSKVILYIIKSRQ